MPAISRDDLQFGYSKTAIPPDDARRTGSPDSTLLNRHEEYEVLDFINRMCAKNFGSNQGTRADALKIERMIQKVPPNLRSHAHVRQWIIDNWSNH